MSLRNTGGVVAAEGLFVEFGREAVRHDQELSQDEFAQAIILRKLKQLYGLDTNAVHISGSICDGGPGRAVTVVVFDDAGMQFTTASIECGVFGVVHVEARKGCDIRKAIRRNPGDVARKQWLRATGFDPSFPCSVQVRMEGTFELSIRIRPCA